MNRNDKTIKLRPSKLQGIPFCWQEVETMNVIRKNYNGKKRTTAIAIYQTLTELASIEGRGKGKHVNQFTTYIKTIAVRCGKSESTIKRYAKEFKDLKIIAWENRKKGKMNLANKWGLLAYSGQDKEPTSQQNNNTNPVGQNDELVKEEVIRKLINNKGKDKNYRNNNGLTHIGNAFH